MDWEQLEKDMTRRIPLRHLSYETEKAYLGWLARFQAFVGRPPSDIEGADAEMFLSYLAMEVRVSGSTQNQAFSALLFLFRHVLRKDFQVDALRARERRGLPVVLSPGEVRRVVSHRPDRFALMERVMYGAGLRLQECLELRVKDVDFDRGLLTVRAGKGDKDRHPARVSAGRLDGSRPFDPRAARTGPQERPPRSAFLPAEHRRRRQKIP